MKQEYRKWSIISVEWDNLYKYGRKNYIDFRKLEGISGVIAKNRWGKSSIIDIIVFGLYGKIMRGTKDTMIHKGEKVSFVKVTFEVNGIEYYIERIDKPPKSRIF